MSEIPLPDFKNDVLHASLLERIMFHLGYAPTAAAEWGDPTYPIVSAAVRAYFYADHPTYFSPGGAREEKTKTQRVAEGHAYKTLRLIIANLPNQPLGLTEFAVGCAIEDAHNEAADDLRG